MIDKILQDGKTAKVTPQGRRIIEPREIRRIMRLAERAMPGPYDLVTDSCDCGDGCGHGEFPYQLETAGVAKQTWLGKDRFDRATVIAFGETDLGMEDGRYFEALDPETVRGLCQHALDGFDALATQHTTVGIVSMFDVPELAKIPTHDLLNELGRRAQGYSKYEAPRW